MGFSGSSQYLASDALKMAVNAAITLEKPLLIKGEPGTGKTVLAEAVADHLGTDLIAWHIKSTTKAQQGLYEYDAVARLRDSQLGDPRVADISHYIRQGKLWQAFSAEQRPVLLIDEIDKAEMQAIVKLHYPDLKESLLGEAMDLFFELREVEGLRKKPSTSELLDWIRLLLADDIAPEAMRAREPGKLVPALYGALLKTEQDLHLFEKLAFLARRGS